MTISAETSSLLCSTDRNHSVFQEARKHAEQFKKVPKLLEDDDMVEETETGEPKISKRKLKKQNRLSVAELKQLVARPDVVEMHDVTARDPRLLVHLKSTRNTVPVPRHWCFKRKYLQGKRGEVSCRQVFLLLFLSHFSQVLRSRHLTCPSSSRRPGSWR